MQQQKWLITGVSTGLGRAFAQAALAAGHTVVGTVRSEEDLRAFEGLEPGYAHGRILDVTDGDAVSSVVAEVEQSVGPLDVVVANAGYGLEGTFEETPLAEVRRQFEVNVFGAVATLQAALPHMRGRRRGHLMAVTSMGGLMAVPGMSAYCGSKFALEGILESTGQGGRTVRDPRDGDRARLLPHRLGRTVHDTRRAVHRRLRRAVHPHP